jgi:hypothetical protein
MSSWEKEDTSTQRIEALLGDHGRRVRQHLWVHALICRNFNPSAACRAVNVSFDVVESWKRQDDRFRKLIEEIHEHKKNFFESQLVKLAKKGDVNAILFANRTLNRDRGYGDKTQVEISGSINHRVENLLNLDELDLPPEVLRVILDHVRKKRDAKNLAEREPAGVLEYILQDGVAIPATEGGDHEHVSIEDAED